MRWSLVLWLLSCCLQFLWARQAATQRPLSTDISKAAVDNVRYVELKDDAVQVNLEGDDLGDIPLEELGNAAVLPPLSYQSGNEISVVTVSEQKLSCSHVFFAFVIIFILSVIGALGWLLSVVMSSLRHPAL